jgi:formate dehydrogenase subunit delta
MSDSTAEIIRMANQIADFFRPYPRDEAEEGVELHIRDFWDPRMRRDLARVLEHDAAVLSDLARAGAIRVFREPAPASAPSQGCDAG